MVAPDTLTLIAITDSLDDGTLIARATAAVRGGATMIQLRLKHVDARTLTETARALVAAVTVPVLVNDRADVALAAGAAGAHLGADDVPLAALRRVVPPNFILGASAGTDDELAAIQHAGADYVGIGPVFATGSKADAGAAIGVDGFARLATAARHFGIPAVAIGGISPANVHPLASTDAAGIAVVSAIFGAPDPASAAAQLRAAFRR
jgi:thiamine-phosphate pyrophosphorylase